MPIKTPELSISIPETRYARSANYHIAYQVIGDGPFDLLAVPGFVSHLDLWWELPITARGLRRLASFARVIIFDKRGTGMSDRVDIGQLPTPEERMDDVRAVMDAVGSSRAAILGWSEGGWMAALFAATYPDRVRALALHATYPRPIQDDDFPEGWLPAAQMQAYLEEIERDWTEGRNNPGVGGSDGSEQIDRWFLRMRRSAASPGAAVALARMDFATDIRAILPSIHVPTLLTVREGDENLPSTRYMAQHIPGARFVVLPGDAHGVFFGDQDALLGEIEEFLTGARTAADTDRVLVSVLFTDIVGSTTRAAQLGDQGWKHLLEEHDAIVRQQLEAYHGRKVNSIGLGDGILATFDGPGRAIRCAQSIRQRLESLGLKIRAGIHTGEVERRGDDIAGLAVNIAARILALAGPQEVLVSETVPNLVAGSGIRFQQRGAHELRGIPGEWHVFAAEG